MFHTLVASDPRTSRSAPRLVASTILHGILVAAAVTGPRPSAPTSLAEARASSVVFIAPLPLPRSLPSLSDLRPGRIAPRPSWPSMSDAPTVSTDQLMSTLPTVSDLLSRMASPSALTAPVAESNTGGGAPWTADSVDDPVEVLQQALLHYPPALVQAAIAGRVDMEFVVDTSGWAEPGSIRTFASTRPEFEAAARAAILHTRYRPARAHGHTVPQLVRQTLSFRAIAGAIAPR